MSIEAALSRICTFALLACSSTDSQNSQGLASSAARLLIDVCRPGTGFFVIIHAPVAWLSRPCMALLIRCRRTFIATLLSGRRFQIRRPEHFPLVGLCVRRLCASNISYIRLTPAARAAVVDAAKRPAAKRPAAAANVKCKAEAPSPSPPPDRICLPSPIDAPLPD